MRSSGRRVAAAVTIVVTIVVLGAAGCTGSPAPGHGSTLGPTSEPTRSHQAVVAEMLARPMRTPARPADGSCPAGQHYGATNAPLGPWSNLVLMIGFRTPGPDDLYDLKVIWGSDASYLGPIVVRVGSLDGENRGAVRLYYQPGASLGDAVVFTLPGVEQDWPSGTFVSGPGCYMYQIDGVNLEQEIVFSVIR
jgi:hypothetical protein